MSSIFFEIKIHGKKSLNTSLDAEFNAIQEQITHIETIDLENTENFEKKDNIFKIGTKFTIFFEFISASRID